MNKKTVKENLIKTCLFVCAAFSIVFVFSIIFYMLYLGRPVIISDILHGFEFLPNMFTTVYVALGGTVLAVIVGLPCAVYMAEFADMRLRNVLKTSLEVMDGFPSIVIGVLGFELLASPSNSYSFRVFLVSLGMRGEGSTLFGWIILAIMSFPVIATISEDALRAVPDDLREASLGIGATKWQTTMEVLLPSATPRVLASILLALAAAMGETVALIWVLGYSFSPQFIVNPFNPLLQTTSLTMAINQQFSAMQEEGGPTFAPHLFAAAFILFIMIGIVNVSIRIITSRQGGSSVSRRSNQ